MNWYTIKVRYVKQLDNGALKRITESYLVKAVSFTEAEAMIHKSLEEIIRGEFKVQNITPFEVHDLFVYGDTGVFYRAKVQYEGIDSDSEKANKVTQFMLIEAMNTKDAIERLNESLKGLLVDYKIPEVKETKIIDIFIKE